MISAGSTPTSTAIQQVQHRHHSPQALRHLRHNPNAATENALRQENGFLEDQLARALKELKCYQDSDVYKRVRAQAQAKADEMPDLPLWNITAATMTPLVAAYDARIEELEEVNQLQAEKLEALADHVEGLVLENEDLHQAALARLENAQQIHLLQQQQDQQEEGEEGGDNAVSDNAVLALPEHEEEEEEEEEGEQEMAQLQEQANFLRAENALLLEQANLAGQEVNRASQALAEKDGQLQEMMEQLIESDRNLQEKEEELAALRGVQAQYETELHQRKSDLSTSGVVLHENQAALEAAQGQVRAMAFQLEESQENAEGLQQQWEREHGIMAGHLQEMHGQLEEIQAELVVKEEENVAIREALDETTAVLKATQEDAAEMVQILEGMQAQIETYEKREQEIELMAARCRGQVEEALLQREQACTGEAQARRELERLLETRRAEAEVRAGEVEAAVVKSKATLVEQYERRERELKEAASRQAQLRAELEQCGRERRRSDVLYTELCGLVKDEHGTVRHQVQELTRRLRESEVAREKAVGQAQAAAAELCELRQTLAEKEGKWSQAKRRLEEQLQSHVQEVATLRAQEHTLKKELSAKAREVARVRRQGEENETAWQEKLGKLHESYQQQVESTAKKLLKAEADLQEREPVLSDFQARHTRILQRIRVEHKAMMDKLQRGLWDERDVVQRVTQENQALLSRLSSTAHDLDASKKELARLQRNLQASTTQVCELSGQLSESLSTQQRLAKEETRLRAQVKQRSSSSMRATTAVDGVTTDRRSRTRSTVGGATGAGNFRKKMDKE